MAKRLTAAFVRSTKPGRYYDEHGLMLRVLPTGAKHWVWRGTVRGRRVDLGLGRFPYTSLAEARQRAFEYRKLSREGGDPRALRTAAPTFADALEKVLAIQRSVLAAGKLGAPSKYQLGLNQPSLGVSGARAAPSGGVREPCGAGAGVFRPFAGPGPEGHSLLPRISWSSAHVSRPSSSRHRMTPSMRTRSSSTIPS